MSAAGAHRPLPTQFNGFLQKTSARQLHTVVREQAALQSPERPGTARNARENPSCPSAFPVRCHVASEPTAETDTSTSVVLRSCNRVGGEEGGGPGLPNALAISCEDAAEHSEGATSSACIALLAGPAALGRQPT